MNHVSVDEVKNMLESAGFHIHIGMKGQITWRGSLIERLESFAIVLNKYYNDLEGTTGSTKTTFPRL